MATPLEVVRRTWTHWEDRDLEGAAEEFRPDVVHDLSHYEGWPFEPVNVGIGPALGALADWMGWWRSYRQDLVGFEPEGDRVLAVMRHQGERDGRWVEGDLGILFTVDGDRVARWEVWSDLAGARAALRGD